MKSFPVSRIKHWSEQQFPRSTLTSTNLRTVYLKGLCSLHLTLPEALVLSGKTTDKQERTEVPRAGDASL